MSRPIEKILAACSSRGLKVVERGGWHRCPHPCHPEGDNRLSFAFLEQQDGVVCVKSHKGYSDLESIKSLGLEWRDLYPEKVTTYAYYGPKGNRVGAVKRTPEKQFVQYRYEGDKPVAGLDGEVLPLYLAPQVESWVSQGLQIHLVEGEKDALSMASRGYPATSKSGGAKSKWHDENARMFDGASVVIVADRDDAGAEAAKMAYLALSPYAKSLTIVEAKDGKDATDHLQAGFSPAEFVARDDLVPPPTTEDGWIVKCVGIEDIGESRAPEGVRTGFKYIDTKNESGGVPKGQMTVVGARKKVGKSAFLVQLACHMLERGDRVLYVTLADLTIAQVFRRMVRQVTGRPDPPDSLETNEDWHEKVKAMRTFWELKFADSRGMHGPYVETVAPGIEALHRRHKFDVVMLDYAQKLKSKENLDRVRAQEKASGTLSDMADRLGFALVVGSQLNEDGGARYSQEWEDDCGLFLDVSAPDGREAPARLVKVPYSRFGPSGYEFSATWNASRLNFTEDK